MLELTLLILAITLAVVAVTKFFVVLKDGKFHLHIRIGKKRDVLDIETEHQKKDK